FQKLIEHAAGLYLNIGYYEGGGRHFLGRSPGFKPVDWQDARGPKAFPNLRRALDESALYLAG
ncbi:MAG: hypothetical protein PVH03_10000, partial [Chloroflexota bacterium]